MSLTRTIRRNQLKKEIGSNKIRTTWVEARYKFLLQKAKKFPKLKKMVKALLFANLRKQRQRLFDKINRCEYER